MSIYSCSSATSPRAVVSSSVIPSAHIRYFLVKLNKKFLNADMESDSDTLVPQMNRVEPPPSASASEVSGLRLEYVASEPGSPLAIGIPSSPTKMRRRLDGVEPNTSEWMSPRRVGMELSKSPRASE